MTKLISFSALLLAAGCVKQAPMPDQAPLPAARQMTATPAGEIVWTPMDPSQPDGLRTAVASGDPATGPSVMLMSFAAGSVAPLHSHTATYTAVVLAGAPAHGVSAEDHVVLDVGSYWVQPGGEPHYDACTGTERCVIMLALEGPRDYAPADAPTTAPVQMKMVRSADVAWAPAMPNVTEVPDIAFLRGDPAVGPFVSMMRFKAGYGSGRHAHDAGYTGGVVSGAYQHGDDQGMVDLGPGAVWWQDGGAAHNDVCGSAGPCVTFQVVQGPMSYIPMVE